MKTRIISGVVLAAVVAAVIAAGKLVCGYIIPTFVCIIAAAAVYELLYNAAGIKNKLCVTVSCIYAFLAVMAIEKSIPAYLLKNCSPEKYDISGNITYILTVLYFIFAVFFTLFSLRKFQCFERNID